MECHWMLQYFFAGEIQHQLVDWQNPNIHPIFTMFHDHFHQICRGICRYPLVNVHSSMLVVFFRKPWVFQICFILYPRVRKSEVVTRCKDFSRPVQNRLLKSVLPLAGDFSLQHICRQESSLQIRLRLTFWR